jgi:hypothetical protein
MSSNLHRSLVDLGIGQRCDGEPGLGYGAVRYVLLNRLPKFADGQDEPLGVLKPGRFAWPYRSNAALIRLQTR